MSQPASALARSSLGDPGRLAVSAGRPGADRLADPDRVLPPGWRRSADRLVVVTGDATGLHVLVADASDGYVWRTVATLAVSGTDTTQWIGQACVTGDGRHAVVVYAPRSITNDPQAMGDGALAAVVNLSTGQVTQVGLGVSAAYFDPGCGTGQTAVLTQGGFGAGLTPALADATRLMTLDATTGKIVSMVTVPGELTSAVPWRGQIAAADGARLLRVGSHGQVSVMAAAAGPVFHLVPDASGGLGFQVVSGRRVQVRRWASGRDRLIATAPVGSVELSQTGGRVFVTGRHARQLGHMPAAWRSLDVPAGADISTTGMFAVTSAVTPLDMGAGVRSTARPDAAQPVYIDGQATASGQQAVFAVPAAPAAGVSPMPRPLLGLGGATAPPGRAGEQKTVRPSAVNPATTTYDPDRTCAVARNDPTIQTYQPSAEQVEWAADQAVQGDLTGKQGPNLYGSGLPAYSPQGIFPAPGLDGGGNVPAQVLLGVLAQESNLDQASDHAIIGQTGNFMPSYNWYGDYASLTLQPGTYVDWAASDCGYGIAQVTTGMCMAGNSNCGSNNEPFPYDNQVAVAIDYEANIAAGLQILEQKWNQLYQQGIIPNDANPKYIENWWFAVWDYNSGMEPDAQNGNTTGCTPGPKCTDSDGDWGLGWVNNPANMSYPPDRPEFLYPSYVSPGGTVYSTSYDLSHPQYWSYEEKVMGFAYYGFTAYNYVKQTWEQAYHPGQWPSSSTGYSQPPYTQFCSQAASTNDHCDPSDVLTGKDSDATDPCQQPDSLADHCWWHWPSTWTNCANTCGQQFLTYAKGKANPGDPGVPPGYAPDCSSSPLPSDAVIVGDTASSIPAPLGCGESWKTNGGTITWKFAPGVDPVSPQTVYPSKIDFHQIGGGYSGHFWFTHTIPSSSASPGGNQPPQTGNSGDAELQVTGTWSPPSSVTGWTRIMAAIPDEGAWDPEANYQISLGNGTTEYRVVNQAYQVDTWVSLGFFDLSKGASVSLSNVTWLGLGDDIAWDAMAFIPASKPAADYVAMGDSYSSAEGLSPYVPTSDYNYSGMQDTCHRSASQSYADLVTLPGSQSGSIEKEAATPSGKVQFAFTACSGVLTPDITENAIDRDCSTAPYSTWCGWDEAGYTDWTNKYEGSGGPAVTNVVAGTSTPSTSIEIPQADQGWLSPTTTLVTITQGGDDARFSSVMSACVEADNIVSPDPGGCSGSNFYLTHNGVVDPQPLYKFEPQVISAVGWHLEQAYAAIAAAAPNAEIIVLGYPRLFAGDLDPSSGCSVDAASEITVPDETMLNSFGDQLDAQISGAVAHEQAAGVDIHYIDPNNAFAGHEVCSSTPWINGVVNEEVSNAGTAIPGTDSFHPMAAGQKEFATLIDECLAGTLPSADGKC